MHPVPDGYGVGENDRLHSPVRELFAFRSRLHGCFRRRTDALFELCDALLSAGSVPSPVHLSLVPVHRRGWSSFYAVLEKAESTRMRSRSCWHPTTLVRRTRRFTRSTFRPCRGVTQRRVLGAATSTIHLAIRRANPS